MPVDRRKQGDVAGALAATGLTAIILGAAMLTTHLLDSKIWLVIVMAVLLIGAILVRLYPSGSLTR